MEVEVCVGSNLSFELIGSDPDQNDILTMTSNIDFALPGGLMILVTPASALFCRDQMVD